LPSSVRVICISANQSYFKLEHGTQGRAAALEQQLRAAKAEHAAVIDAVRRDAEALLAENARVAALAADAAARADSAAAAAHTRDGERDSVVRELMEHVQAQSARLKQAQVCCAGWAVLGVLCGTSVFSFVAAQTLAGKVDYDRGR
jgi:hypothetical protein